MPPFYAAKRNTGMLEKYPGVMMPSPEELTPEVKKAISESIDKRTIDTINPSPVIHMQFGNPFHDSVKTPTELVSMNEDDFTVRTEEPPKRVAIIGGPRNIASQLIHAFSQACIELTQTNDRPRDQFYDESKLIGSPNMKTISPAMLLNKHHLGATPYARGNKPRMVDLSETLRKDMRKVQNATNKANGFGKRLTKKDKTILAKQPIGAKYTEAYQVKRNAFYEIDASTGKVTAISED